MIEGVEGDTAFDEENITPMQFDDEDQADFSEHEMIAFKEVR
ncbi:threonyl-tRNA synthetase [Aggregatibacter actinomycetemcomitans SC383s]|nr:threonyl-tRNA synthetase [Aggregatibacter actinomycetemcomitans SC383s]